MGVIASNDAWLIRHWRFTSPAGFVEGIEFENPGTAITYNPPIRVFVSPGRFCFIWRRTATSFAAGSGSVLETMSCCSVIGGTVPRRWFWPLYHYAGEIYAINRLLQLLPSTLDKQTGGMFVAGDDTPLRDMATAMVWRGVSGARRRRL